jgi:hypothetical protein
MSASARFPLIPNDKRGTFSAARRAVRDALRAFLPMQVYGQLLESGWPREWAEELVRDVETKDNPSGQLYGAAAHRIAARAQVRIVTGALLLIAGLVVTVGSLVSAMRPGGGLVVIAYGAIFSGIGLLVSGVRESRRYPHRPLPGRGIFEESGTMQPKRNPNDPY